MLTKGRGRSRLLGTAAGAVVATVLVTMGLAYAQTDGGDVYSGCLNPGGAITDVAIGDEPLKPCTGNKIPVSWNQTGPEGPGGPQGPAGEVGPSGPPGEPGPGQDEFDAIRADLDALLEVIDIDPVTGAVTIASTDDLILESGDLDEVVIMDDAMLEGDTTLMENATVMGETMLEGDTMLMEDAEFMGDATFEGGLVLPDTAATVDVDGVLTPTSSSVTVTGFDGALPLLHIPPAASDGTILEIHFGTSTEAVNAAGGNGSVNPCGVCGVSGFLRTNIDLKQRRFEPFTFDAGDTLRLVSSGDTWVEVSRSSGHTEAFNVVVSTVVNANSTRVDIPAGCTALFPGGREGAILLTSSVNVLGLADVVVDDHTVEVIPFGPSAGTEVVYTTLTNPSAFFGPVEIALRCLSI